jgi:phosphoglycolate phosphatase
MVQKFEVNLESSTAKGWNAIIRNIIFDMDGTLVDTAKATVPVCIQCARELGLPPRDPASIRELIGWSNPEFYFRMYPEIPKELVLHYAAEVEAREARYIQELGRDILFPGMGALLDILKSRDYYLAVASTGSPEHVEVSLRASGIQEFFDIIRCGEPVKIQMVRDIIGKGLKGDWLIVGDKDKDAEAGKENGIVTVGAVYGYGSTGELKMFDFRIDTPLNLLKYLSE